MPDKDKKRTDRNRDGQRDTSRGGAAPDSGIADGPSISTLDTLAFGDEGPRAMLRNAGETDLPQLMKLMQEAAMDGTPSFPPVSEEKLRQAMGPGGRTIVADIGDVVPVGFAIVVYNTADDELPVKLTEDEQLRTLKLEAAAMRPDWHNKDLLSDIISLLLEGSAQRGFTLALADLPADRPLAVKMLEKLGFRKIKTVRTDQDGDRYILRFDTKAVV